MKQRVIHVGVKEFREDMAQYLDSPVPVAITRHGRTVGYYVPAHQGMDAGELLALKQAVKHFATLLTDHGVAEDEVVSAFRGRRTRG